MINKQRIVTGKRVLAASWGQLSAALVGLFAIRVYSGILGPELFGQAMLALGIVSLADGILGMAYSQTNSFLLRDVTFGPERSELESSIAAGFFLLLIKIVSILGATALTTCILWNLRISPVLSLVTLATTVMYVAEEPVRIASQVHLSLSKRFNALSTWVAADAVASLLLTYLFVKLLPSSPLTLTLGLVAGRLASTLVFAPIFVGIRSFVRADLKAFSRLKREIISFAIPVSLMAPIGWLSLYSDRYIVGYYVGPVSAGILAALSGAVTRPYSIVSSSLTTYYKPEMLSTASAEAGRRHTILKSWLVAAAAVGLLGVAGAIILGRDLTSFLLPFARQSSDAASVLVVVALSQLVVLLTHAVDNQVLAVGRSRALLLGQVVAVVLGLPLIALGAWLGGLVGAAWGRVANEALKLLFASGTLFLANR